MIWTKLHAALFERAFERVLGRAEPGSVAFVRCLTPDVVAALAGDMTFEPEGWYVARVADVDDASIRTIQADRAVEMREDKGDAAILLVDTSKAGAGMDGIYGASREIDETSLFVEAMRLAAREVTRVLSRSARDYAERALKKARGHGRRFSISRWTEFDFLVRVADGRTYPGEHLHLLGLWPVQECDGSEDGGGLDVSRMFVDRLLGTAVSSMTPSGRIEALKLLAPSEQQTQDLERFLRVAATKPLTPALEELASQRHLWVNALKIEGAAHTIQSIELSSWRTRTDRIAKWSGLEEGDEEAPPVLILKADADKTGDYRKLEVRWKAQPENLEKGAVVYRVVIQTDMEEELASRDVSHSGGKEEKCRFTNDDFSMLSEDALISSKVIVSVIGNNTIESEESEEFIIRFGEPPEREKAGVGKKMRTFSEGLIELDDREMISALAASSDTLPVDSKGFVLLRTPQRGKSFRVFRPPLIDEVERQWIEQAGIVARWVVKVRASGARVAEAQLVPLLSPDSSEGASDSLRNRVTTASRRMAERFATCGGGVGQVYDDTSKFFDTVVKEYLLAWAALLEKCEPSLALASTVEVQSLSGRTLGLIVLPSHPLRVAWHVALDNLVLHSCSELKMPAKEIREELSALDGAMFPAFLPGLESGKTFVFADTLGFHAVGMVLDNDKEPKAAVAILARALGGSGAVDAVPTVGKQSAQVLGNEIIKYLDSHDTSRLLHIHALRAGDGLTVARSLGYVNEQRRPVPDDEDFDLDAQTTAPAFVLELYPSLEQRGVAGRFIAEAREKRRTGAGVLAPEDQWMLESLSLPGGVNIPRLRWARKAYQDPNAAAHLAVAFDTFESQVVPLGKHHSSPSRPFYAFGLLSFFERDFSSNPSPIWKSVVPLSLDGEKHPSDRAHTDRLVRLQQVLHLCVSRSIGADEVLPMLTTLISPEKEQSLRELHRLCDWVITLDRNAGIEYFDSPQTNRKIYDAYVIDCVPEREDLGCLQLITSTSNLDEVRNLLDGALDQMGLSRSRRNAEFLMEHLKALSGRLAIRLTGQRAPTSELVALALCHANCASASSNTKCWMPLADGFIMPVDDIRDLLPPLRTKDSNGTEKDSRPDLIYVAMVPRKGLFFRFIEIKYRRHLRSARNPEGLEGIRQQVESLRERWDDWYASEDVCCSFRALRRAKLARVLRFYVDKAHRHYLTKEQHERLASEIARMIEKGADYSFPQIENGDRGWVFCPEYNNVNPLEISPARSDTRIFLFGPGFLPDSSLGQDLVASQSETAGPSSKSSLECNEYKVRQTRNGSHADEPVYDLGDQGPPDSERFVKESANSVVQSDPSVCLGTDLLTGTKVRWPMTVRGNPHLLMVGLPGMGKTTCLLSMCKQMLDADIWPIIFSYHQDIDERLLLLVDSVRFVDIDGLGFNPLQIVDRSSRMTYLDVAGALRDIFVAIFPEIGELQGEQIRRSIKESFIEKGWNDPNANLAELDEPPFKRFVEILRDKPKPDRGLRNLLARLEELDDYGFFDVSTSHENLWDSREPTIIRIHGTQNDNLQKAFASLVFYGLYKDMFRRGIQVRVSHFS